MPATVQKAIPIRTSTRERRGAPGKDGLLLQVEQQLAVVARVGGLAQRAVQELEAGLPQLADDDAALAHEQELAARPRSLAVLGVLVVDREEARGEEQHAP